MSKRLSDARKAKHRNYESFVDGLVDKETFDESFHARYSAEVVDCERAIRQLDEADESYWGLGRILLELPETLAGC